MIEHSCTYLTDEKPRRVMSIIQTVVHKRTPHIWQRKKHWRSAKCVPVDSPTLAVRIFCQQLELATIFAAVTMLTRSATRLLTTQTRAFSTSSARQTKLAVLGAGGGIGQPLSLLLKIDPLVSSLSLYDIRGAPGVAADVSHIDTNSSVCCFVSCQLLVPYSKLVPTH